MRADNQCELSLSGMEPMMLTGGARRWVRGLTHGLARCPVVHAPRCPLELSGQRRVPSPVAIDSVGTLIGSFAAHCPGPSRCKSDLTSLEAGTETVGGDDTIEDPFTILKGSHQGT